MKDEKITDREAFYKAEELRHLALKKKESFAMETVFSHESKLELMREAKKTGYEVSLIFVTTFDKEINVDRVAGRVKEGGHDVPLDKIRARYDRVMGFMPEAISIADKSVVFNNSLDKPVAILRKYRNGEIKIYPQKEPSQWNKEKLEKLVEEIRSKELENITIKEAEASYNIENKKEIKKLPLNDAFKKAKEWTEVKGNNESKETQGKSKKRDIQNKIDGFER